MGNPTFANPTATIPDLTPVSGLTGAELIWVNQTGGDFSATIGDITGFASAGSLPSTGGQISGNLTVVGGLGAGGSLNVAGPATFQTSPTAPTPPPGDNSNSLATTAFVDQLVNTIPAGGTVTSVGLAMPGLFTITGSPVTRTGTLTAALNAQNPNTVWAGPASGAADIPAFRALTQADIGPIAVTSFNGQTGNVTLGPNDVSAIAVGSFNGRQGAVTLTAADVAAAGGPYATTASLVANYLPLTGGTLTGQLTVTNGAGLRLNGASGQDRALNLTTNNGMRWRITSNMDAETGSNTGSNLGVYSFDDTGSLLASALIINRASAAASFAGNVSGGSYTSNGSNAGIYYNPRNGSGSQFCSYNLDGNLYRIWESSYGDIATFNSTVATFVGQVLATAAGNQGQLRFTPYNNASSYGAMWRNDGSNTYFLLTNQNDAFGSWNGLRPLTINDANGAVSMSQGLTVTGHLTADDITTQYGIVYSALAGNNIAFRWTGALQEFIDGNYNGDIITSSNWTSYIPNANNNPAGCVLRSGDTMSGRLNVPTITLQGIGIIYSQFNTNNNIAFKWSGGLQEYIDGTYQGTIQASCDARIKTNRGPPQVDPLVDLLQVNLESFDMTLLPGDPPKFYPIGMIAQNLQAIGPDMVDVGIHYDENGNPTGEDRLAVAILPVMSRLIGAVQQLTARVETLEAALRGA